jgi:rsbT co-antagonist protein RsbR
LRPERQDDGVIVWDGLLMDITTRKQAEEALRRSSVQDETIRAQAAILDELSIPLLPISDQVVVMPLVGAVDTQRTQRVVESLLHGVEALQAQIAILDI